MKNLFSTLILSLLALGCTQQQPESLRLATFNIRYDNSGDGPNSWPHRKDSICAFIHRVDPDIIDMQEVLHHQLEVLKTGLPEYTVVGVGREDGKTAGEYTIPVTITLPDGYEQVEEVQATVQLNQAEKTSE